MVDQIKYEDIDFEQLRSCVTKLETEIINYSTEKAALEKLIQDYNRRFYIAVGDLMSEVNRLRLEELKASALKDPEKLNDYKNAKKESAEFNSQYQKIVSRDTPALNETEQKLLKTNFRKASLLCHPDSIADEFKEEATKIFTDLMDAYKENNITKVNSILDRLQSSSKFPKKSDSITDQERYKLLLEPLRLEVMNLKHEINKIKRSEIYQHITSIGDWDVYFSHIRKQLENEIDRLKSGSSNN